MFSRLMQQSQCSHTSTSDIHRYNWWQVKDLLFISWPSSFRPFSRSIHL